MQRTIYQTYSDQIDDIYDVDKSEGVISDVTNKLIHEIKYWQQCPLSCIYLLVHRCS